MLKQVAIDQAEADVVKEKVSAEEATLAKQSAEVKAVADDAQADLDVAMPALNNAVKALDSLTKADITEVKAFAKPARVAASFVRRRRDSSGFFFAEEAVRTASTLRAGPRGPDHHGGRLRHARREARLAHGQEGLGRLAIPPKPQNLRQGQHPGTYH